MNRENALNLPRLSTAEQVVSVLREKILSGEFRPGMGLTEVAFADTFGISRNTMREAFRILVHEGLARHSPHRRVVVATLSVEEISDIYRSRRTLELAGIGALAAEAQRGGSVSCISVLASAVEAMESAVQRNDWGGVVAADMRFHQGIVSAIGSQHLEKFYESLLRALRLVFVATDRVERNTDRLLAEHRELLRFASIGAYVDLALAVRAHLDDSENRVKMMVERQPRDSKGADMDASA